MPTLKDYEILKHENDLLLYNMTEARREKDKCRDAIETLLTSLFKKGIISSWQYNGERL